MNTFKGSPLALPLTFETHQLSEGFSSIVYDAHGMAIDTHLSEAQAETLVTAVNAYAKQRALIEMLVKALEEIAGARWKEDGDLDDVCTVADRALEDTKEIPR